VKSINRTILAALVAGTLLPLHAAAVDITVKVPSGTGIKPWFRSNCWVSDMPQTTDWVDFGFIQVFTQFTWTEFEVLMKAKCRRPYLELSYTVAGEATYEASNPRRIVAIKPTRVTDAYVVTLGSGTTVKDVQLNGIEQE